MGLMHISYLMSLLNQLPLLIQTLFAVAIILLQDSYLGDAGTCWAFSAVQTIEGQWAIKTGNVTELSVEQVVDCDGSQDDKK